MNDDDSAVGADLSRPPPIYRPTGTPPHFPINLLIFIIQHVRGVVDFKSFYLFPLHKENAVARVRNVAATRLAMKPGRTLSCGSLGFSGRLYTEGRSISKKNALRSPTLVSSSTP